VFVQGCFNIERNIRGLTTREIELRLGFRAGRLTHGARILALDREPHPDEFEPLGSTRFAHGTGLSKADLHASKFIPGAWLGERLIKVEPMLPHSAFEWYPSSPTGAEQWKLTRPISGHEICQLKAGQRYWGR
jgi:hypothetical protein